MISYGRFQNSVRNISEFPSSLLLEVLYNLLICEKFPKFNMKFGNLQTSSNVQICFSKPFYKFLLLPWTCLNNWWNECSPSIIQISTRVYGVILMNIKSQLRHCWDNNALVQYKKSTLDELLVLVKALKNVKTINPF